MSARFVATVGNGRLLAKIGADGSLLSLCTPHLDSELLQRPVHATIELGSGRKRRVGGRGWKHRREYVRGTNVLRVLSRHATGTKVERRIAAIDETLALAFRFDGEADVTWEHGLEPALPGAGGGYGGVWPRGFDPPPLAGATSASVVARVPHLADRAAITGLYARSVLALAQHHDRSGAFTASPVDGALIAHALDVSGERGAARAFFEWAVGSEHVDPRVGWALDRHLRWSYSASLRARLTKIQADVGIEPPSPPGPGTAATLWGAWQDAVEGRREGAIAALQAAALKRSSLRLFLAGGGVDLRAHALLLLTVHALVPARGAAEDGFFENQASAQSGRRGRALYGGAFHSGMPEPGNAGQIVAEVRSDLEVSAATVEVQDRPPQAMEAMPEKAGHPAGWTGQLPAVEAGHLCPYRVKVPLREPAAASHWASGPDPRPRGPGFAFEPAPP